MRSDLVALETALAMLGKFGITSAFMGGILLCTELFPTTLRSTALNLGFFGGRIGNILAPYTPYVVSQTFLHQCMYYTSHVTVIIHYLSLRDKWC